jgi:hypothetical protein
MREHYLKAACIVDCVLRFIELVENAELATLELAIVQLRYRDEVPGRIPIRSQGKALDYAKQTTSAARLFLWARREELRRAAEEAGGAL